jgi:hypothetical protein
MGVNMRNRDVAAATCSITVWIVIFILGRIDGAAAEATSSAHDWTIENMHTHPWFITVMLASVGGWILGIAKGFSTSVDWMKRYVNHPPAILILFIDLLVFVVFGAYIGTGIYNPSTFVAAIAAGIKLANWTRRVDDDRCR